MTSHLKSPLVIALIICLSAPLMRCDGRTGEVAGEGQRAPVDLADAVEPDRP